MTEGEVMYLGLICVAALAFVVALAYGSTTTNKRRH